MTRCGGGYDDPLAGVDKSADPAASDIEASAEESRADGDTVHLHGSVHAQQGYRHLRAGEAEFNRAQSRGSLRGDVELREPGLLLRGDTGTVNTASGRASLTASQFVLHDRHIHGGAELITRHPDETIDLDNAWYSYCPPRQRQWTLRAETLKLNLETGTGTARNATVQIQGVPVAYTPYLQFPIDGRRKSGFLWPEVSSGGSSGRAVDFTLPYYFNLAPHYDLTFTPSHVTDQGLLAGLEARYLGRSTGHWVIGGSWLDGDDQYRKDHPGQDGDRWLLSVQQRGLFKQRWRSAVRFTDISDNSYFSDLNTSSLQVTQSTHLAQTGEVDYLGDSWLTRLRVERHKTIDPDIGTRPHRKLPQLTVVRTAPERDFHPNLLFQSDYTQFDHDTDVTGHRWHNSLGVSYPMNWAWGFLRPALKYRQIDYRLDDQPGDDTPGVGAPLLSLDGGLFFERDTAWGLQTLEPRLHYLWAESENHRGLPNFDTSRLSFNYHQLFRETPFAGLDRLNDANRVSVGLTSRLLDPATGRQILAASMGQTYHFDDRRVSDGQLGDSDSEGSSAVIAQLAVSPAKRWQLDSSWLWDTDEDKLGWANLHLGWRGDRGTFNLGYNFRRYRGSDPARRDSNQADVSAALPLNDKWAVFLHSQYDLEGEDRINDLLGIEYNSCCWRIRLVHQRHLDQTIGGAAAKHENATYLEFQLKGLGGIGTSVGGLLEQTIRGYRDHED